MTAQPQPAAETLHLRRFIEKQPACILRAGLDGVLLAVNEAALSLIGAERLAQVLGTKLTRFITPRQQDEWEEFATRVREGASGSIECDLTDMSGTRRTILLQGVPLLDHPDGTPSMILSARDISAPRRLEMALREREVTRELDELQRQLEHGVAERQQLAMSLSERETSHQELMARHAADQERLQRTLVEQHELALLLKDQEARQMLDALRADLEQALLEGQRLAASVREREAELQRVHAQHAGDRAQLQQALAEEHQLALILKEREARGILESLKAELEKSLAERQRLAAAIEEREARHQQAIDEYVAEREQLRQFLAEERQLLLQEQQERQRLERVKAELDSIKPQLENVKPELESARTELQGVRKELESVKATLETSLAEREQLQQAFADERRQLEASLAERDASHERVAAAHAADRARLEQALDEEHRLAQSQKEESRQLLEKVNADLEQALADRQRLVASLEERAAGQGRLIDEHAAARAEAERGFVEATQKQAEIEKALADVRVELQSVDENARDLEWLAAAGRAAREIGRELQTIVAAVEARTRHLLAQSPLDAETRQVVESLRGDAIGAASLVRQIVNAGEAGMGRDAAAPDDATSQPSDEGGKQTW